VNSDEEFATGCRRISQWPRRIEGATRKLPSSAWRRSFTIVGGPEELILMQLTAQRASDTRESYERRFPGCGHRACRPHRIIDRLEQITVPTLLIWDATISAAL